MSKIYSTDNECLLTGGLFALAGAVVVGLISWIFFELWPTSILVFVVVFLVGFAVAVFMCKTRTVGRGGVDISAVDIARAEMGLSEAPERVKANAAKVEADAAAEAQAAKAAAEKVKAAEDAKATAAKAAQKAKADQAKAAKKAATEAAQKAKLAKAEKEKAEVKVEAVADVQVEDVAKPKLLKKARDGKADDLKLIKGVGPKLEKELNAAGVFHFDQIANWSKEEIVWADQHLVSFKGRVSRDNWVVQAKDLIKT